MRCERLTAAHAYLYAGMFDVFDFHAPENWLEREQQRAPEPDADVTLQPCVSFELHMKKFIEVINVLSTRKSMTKDQATMLIKYDGVGEPLYVALKHPGGGVAFEMRTLDMPIVADIPFESDKTQAQLIMDSNTLLPYWREAVQNAKDTIHIAFYPSQGASKGRLELSTENEIGTSDVVIPYDDAIMEKFTCHTPVRRRYQLAPTKAIGLSATFSNKTSLRVDVNGILSAQFMIQRTIPVTVAHTDPQLFFVDHKICPLE